MSRWINFKFFDENDLFLENGLGGKDGKSSGRLIF